MKKILLCLCICALAASWTGCGKTDEKLDETNKQIEQLNDKIDKLVNIINDYNDYDEEIHEIYDDTAVVEAYKSGDSSKLTDEKDKYILEEATKVIDEKIKDSMTDYEKEKAIYDYMFEITSFDEDSLAAISSTGEYSHTPYGFFKEHSTICVGNATTFKLFMDMLDIDCQIIYSTIEGEHAWNIVKLDDGWYHVDLTFDNSESDAPSYSFFNVTDEAKDTGDYPWDKSEFPECNATEYCYGAKNAIEIESVYDIPQQIKNAIENDQESIFVKFPVPSEMDPQEYKQAAYDTLQYLESEEHIVYAPMSMLADDDKNVLINISITYFDYGYDYEDYSYLIDADKLNEEFDKVFEGEMSLYYYDYEEDIYE